MINHFTLVCILTMIIHFIGIIGLSARVVGTRTKKLGSSISLFNLLIVISSLAQTLQLPLLTKSIESSISSGVIPEIINFRIILFFATGGAFLGAFFLPTAHRFMAKGVDVLYVKGSVLDVIILSLKPSIIRVFINSLTLPRIENIYRLKRFKDLNVNIIFLNAIVYAFVTVSVIACLYAGCMNITYRTTALAMSGVAVGLASLSMLLFIEPYNSTLTDKVIDGSVEEAYFRRHIVYIIFARISGTLLSQFFLIPIAKIVSFFASIF
jgi:hypothetical protein